MRLVPFIFIFTLCFLTGCVERYITVSTEPQGAIVWLNDEEVGSTPLTVPFTWYGDYDVVIRKDGYKTIKQPKKAEAPIYQWVGLDLIAECLLPFNFVDEHRWDFELTSITEVDSNAFIERAKQLKKQVQ